MGKALRIQGQGGWVLRALHPSTPAKAPGRQERSLGPALPQLGNMQEPQVGPSKLEELLSRVVFWFSTLNIVRYNKIVVVPSF